MRLSRRAQWALRVFVGLGLAFIYVPLVVIGIYAFNSSRILKWPPPSLTTEWFKQAFESDSVREAFLTSIEVGLVATVLALLLGSLAALAVGRHRFFGRETVSFLVILPIALPGIVTGVAHSPFPCALYCRTRNFTNVTGARSPIITSSSAAAIGGRRIHG